MSKADRTEQDLKNIKVLKRFKKRNKLTQEWAAALLGCRYKTFTHWEAGTNPIPEHLLATFEMFELLSFNDKAILKAKSQPR